MITYEYYLVTEGKRFWQQVIPATKSIMLIANQQQVILILHNRVD